MHRRQVLENTIKDGGAHLGGLGGATWGVCGGPLGGGLGGPLGGLLNISRFVS